MPLYLRDLLADPSLGLELVAGHKGLNERGPVRWAHISEIPDPTPWLEGGEVLLTTGLGVKDSEDLQRRLIEGLTERGCAAVGFGLDIFLGAVPPAMVTAANDCGLPLFTVPYETPFLAVTKRVSHHTSEEHYAMLRVAVNLHRQVLAAVVGGGGIQKVIAAAAGSLTDLAVVVFDYYGTELARHDPSDSITADPVELWTTATSILRSPEGDPSEGPEEHPTDGEVVSVSPIRLAGEVQAVVVAVGSTEAGEHQTLVLEQVVTGTTLELARGLSVREAHRSRVDDLLAEATAGRGASPWLTRLLPRLGFVVGQPYTALCLRPDARLSHNNLCALVEDVVSADTSSGCALVGRLDDAVYCLLQPPQGFDPNADYGVDHAERIVAAARSRGGHGVVIGRSAVWTSLDDLSTALRQAATAAEASTGSPIRDVRDLGLAGVVAGMNDDVVATSFVRQVLGPLLDHDQTDGSSFVDTLAAYLDSGCRPGPAAKHLCVHRHTLAYRLERIRDLTGRDPREGQHLIEFGLALELHRAQTASDA